MSDPVQLVPANRPSDRECLESWRRQPGAELLRSIVERYLAFVYSAAYRRIGNAAQAAEVARAVFLVLARRARKLRKKTVLAGWLFEVTALACRKLQPKRSSRWRWFGRRSSGELQEDAPLWTRIAPEFDAALDKLPSAQRNAVLLRTVLNNDWETVAKILRTREPRVRKRVARGLNRLTRCLHKRGVIVDGDTLAVACVAEGCAAPAAEGLAEDVLTSIERSLGKRPSFNLARRTLNTLAWKRWRRRFVIGVPSVVVFLAAAAGTAWYIDSLSGHSRLITAFLFWSVRHEAKTVPGLAQPARPWPSDMAGPRLSAGAVRSAKDLYQMTNIWLAHLKFSREQWKELEPKRIAVLPNFLQPNGTVLLRNPRAQRSGLAGVLGLDFNWTHADFEIGGRVFTNVASRFKGNGTYLSSLYGSKHPFKVDLNKFSKGQKLGGVGELNFHNLVDDRSYMSDTLAYEFFRDAGVPAPHTAYAYLSVSVDRKWEHRPLGLYAMVEAVNGAFATEQFGSKSTPIFKPVTLELFEHLGDDWPAYKAVYDLKTKATSEQQRRVVDFARLVSYASDAEFGIRLGDFLDLDEFARFLAVEVLLASYDSLFSNGQNFYLYLDKSNKFGFIPWDLDMAWGGFFLLGTTKERERASIWHPWVGQNRFLERIMAVEEFRRIYRAHLEDFCARLLVPERLYRRIDEMAALIRGPVAAESDFRLAKFDQAVSDKPAPKPSGRDSQGANRPVHQLKRFIKNRAAAVRQQLDGKSNGIILHRGEGR